MDPVAVGDDGRCDGLTRVRSTVSTASATDVAAPPASGWLDAEMTVRLRRGLGATVRVDGVLCSAPLWCRWDGTTLWLVGSGASPVGEDHIRVRVDVGPGVNAVVRSVAATVVYAARGAGTRWDTEIHVAHGARLGWRPDPVILTERARHETTTTVHAASGAAVTLDEVLVLGRDREVAGALRSTIDVRIDGAPRLLTSIDTTLPGWSGAGGVGGARVVAHRLRLDLEHAPMAAVAAGTSGDATLLRPAPGCDLAVAVADDVAGARRSIETMLPG